VQDLKPNPQDTSTVYLAGIYQLLADSSDTHASIPPILAQPTVFSPPRYAVWVNSLWFLSLFVGLTAAVMATSLQEWARRYIKIIRHPRCSPDKRARIRAFLANGSHKSHLLMGGDGLTGYVHLAIFLFVIGALIYLYNINHTVFIVVVIGIGYFAFVYLFFTLLPIFYSDVFICTPLSSIMLRLYLGTSYVVIGVFSCITRCHRLRDDIKRRRHEGFMPGKWRRIKEAASKPSSKIDALVLEEIFLSLDEDSALEKFIDAIPGFCNSPIVNAAVFPSSVQEKLQQALDGFLDQAFSFASVSESVGSCRLISCLNAAHAALPSNVTLRILDDILNGRWTEALQSVEIGHSLRRWSLLKDNSIDLKIRRIIACIIACARGRDERWMMLIKDEFGVQDRVLRDQIAHGNSPLLTILIHVIRQSLVGNYRSQQEVLRSLSEFDIIDTLPGLQHNFCALWNELVQEARTREDPSFPIEILREIRYLYISLHKGTDSDAVPIDEPAFNLYPFCNIAGHHQHSPASTHTGGLSPSTSGPGIPSWCIQLGDSLNPSSPQCRWVLVNVPNHPAPLDSQQLPATPESITDPADTHPFLAIANRVDRSTPSANTVSQQEEYENIVPEHPSCPDMVTIPSATPSMPGFPSPSPTTHLAHIPLQATPTAYPSIPVNPGGFLHPNLMATPIRVTAATGPVLPSSLIQNPLHTASCPRPTNGPSPGDVPNAPRYIMSVVGSPQPSECNEQQDMATQGVAQDPCETSFMASHISHFIPTNGTTLGRNEEITIVPPVSGSTLSPALMSAPCSNMIPAELPSSVETSLQQIDTSGAPRSSSPTTVPSHICLQCTLIVDTDDPISIGATTAHDDAPVLNPPPSIEAHQPALATPDRPDTSPNMPFNLGHASTVLD